MGNQELGRVSSIYPQAISSPQIGTDEAQWRAIRRVNAQVNGEVRQLSDMESSGVDELWQRPTGGKFPTGDCEDIAIEKRVRLLSAGIPAARMFYAIVYHHKIGLHTILIVRMDEGDFILDSRTPLIRRWSDAPYSWIRQQSPDNPVLWYGISMDY
jgi:predicted transglutaminase-like cysteine proteinase